MSNKPAWGKLPGTVAAKPAPVLFETAGAVAWPTLGDAKTIKTTPEAVSPGGGAASPSAPLPTTPPPTSGPSPPLPADGSSPKGGARGGDKATGAEGRAAGGGGGGGGACYNCGEEGHISRDCPAAKKEGGGGGGGTKTAVHFS